MKFTVFFITICIFLSLNVQQKCVHGALCLEGSDEKLKSISTKKDELFDGQLAGSDEKKKGNSSKEDDIVGVQLTGSDLTIKPKSLKRDDLVRVQQSGEEIEIKNLKRGQIVAAQLPGTDTIKYDFVWTDGISPFEVERLCEGWSDVKKDHLVGHKGRVEPKIIKVFDYKDVDYLANVEKYIGEIVPEWVYKLAEFYQRLRDKRKSNILSLL